MKKLLLLIVFLLSICFVGKVDAKILYLTEQEEIFKVQEGDLICGLNSYFYGLYAYTYDNEEVKYVGRFTYQAYDMDEYEYVPEYWNYSSGEIDFCVKVDRNEIYENAPGGIPDTNEFIIYQEDYYAGKISMVPYYTPEVSITCDKEVIEYGETAECVLGVVKERVNYELTLEGPKSWEDDEGYWHSNSGEPSLESYKPSYIEEATFNFTNEKFKIVDYSSNYEVEVLGAQYELKLNEEGQDKNNYELLRFTITPVSPDEEGTGYVIAADDFTLMSNLGNVTFSPSATMGIRKAEKKENPNTTSINIYALVLAAGLAMVLFVLAVKNSTFKKIS